MGPLKLVSVIFVLALIGFWTKVQGRRTWPVRPKPSPSLTFSYDAVYDLQNNVITSHPKVTVVSPITGTGCSSQGVLKLELASAAIDPKRRRVLVDFFFDNPTGWVFNLGDSVSNDGYAGDSNDQTWDAEIQGVVSTFNGYLSDHGSSVPSFHILELYKTRLSLIVGDGHVAWIPDDNNLSNYYNNRTLFALNGQLEPDGSSNYDLYLGMNRVIRSNYRSGTGLCKVGIKFLPEF